MDDPPPHEDATGDPAPDAQSPLPDRQGPPPFVRHLAPARGEVVETSTDDAAGHPPHGHPQHEIPIAAEPRPSETAKNCGGDDAEEEHEPVGVNSERAQLERPTRGAGDRGLKHPLILSRTRWARVRPSPRVGVRLAG